MYRKMKLEVEVDIFVCDISFVYTLLGNCDLESEMTVELSYGTDKFSI